MNLVSAECSLARNSICEQGACLLLLVLTALMNTKAEERSLQICRTEPEKKISFIVNFPSS